VASHVVKQTKHLFRRRPLAVAFLRVKRQLFEALGRHRITQVPLEESVNKDGEKIEKQKSFDSRRVFQVYRHDFQHRLELLMPSL
jgi:hypothetical protein